MNVGAGHAPPASCRHLSGKNRRKSLRDRGKALSCWRGWPQRGRVWRGPGAILGPPGNTIHPTSVSPKGPPPSPQGEGFSQKYGAGSSELRLPCVGLCPAQRIRIYMTAGGSHTSATLSPRATEGVYGRMSQKCADPSEDSLPLGEGGMA